MACNWLHAQDLAQARKPPTRSCARGEELEANGFLAWGQLSRSDGRRWLPFGVRGLHPLLDAHETDGHDRAEVRKRMVAGLKEALVAGVEDPAMDV